MLAEINNVDTWNNKTIADLCDRIQANSPCNGYIAAAVIFMVITAFFEA